MARKKVKVEVVKEEIHIEIRDELKETLLKVETNRLNGAQSYSLEEAKEKLKTLSVENTIENSENAIEILTEIPVVESVLPVVNAMEPKVEVKIITAKLDCFINNEPNGQFLTKDREYIIINGNDKAFTILNDKGEHHLFLYEDAKDKFNF